MPSVTKSSPAVKGIRLTVSQVGASRTLHDTVVYVNKRGVNPARWEAAKFNLRKGAKDG